MRHEKGIDLCNKPRILVTKESTGLITVTPNFLMLNRTVKSSPTLENEQGGEKKQQNAIRPGALPKKKMQTYIFFIIIVYTLRLAP